MKICLPIFNRATYARCKVLIQELAKVHDLTLVLSSTLLEEEFGNAQEYIKEDLPDVTIKTIEVDYSNKNHRGMCSAGAQILDHFGARDLERRSHQRYRRTELPRESHAPQPPQTRAAQDMVQNRFGLIVGRVPGGNISGPPLLGRAG